MTANDLTGTFIGGYQIGKRLGIGGMGAVYLAEHRELQKKVAVKILLPEYKDHLQVVKRFFNEARVVSRLNHPSIVEVHDYSQLPDGTLYILMEYVDGIRLRDYLQEKKVLSLAETLDVLIPLAGALHAAHQKLVVHRDVKPENIMLSFMLGNQSPSSVKLLDFGVAKLLRPQQEGGKEPPMTVAGAILGTPRYMSPEQARGAVQNIGPATDIYALGVIAYECLTGRVPFASRNFQELAVMHNLIDVPKMEELASLGALRPQVEAVVYRCLAKQPDERFPSAHELELAFSGLREQVRGKTTALPMVAAPALSGSNGRRTSTADAKTVQQEDLSAAPRGRAATPVAEPAPTKIIPIRATTAAPVLNRNRERLLAFLVGDRDNPSMLRALLVTVALAALLALTALLVRVLIG